MGEALGQITRLLSAVGEGDASAREELWSLIYEELHALAQRQLAGEAPGRTLQPTALVHEVYLRLFGAGDMEWVNRRHFFAAAAQAMRRIRIEDARRRNRLKRGGGQRAELRDETPVVFDQDPAEVLAIDEGLKKLESQDARAAEVVSLRYFAGLTIEETAAALGVSTGTVDNDWRFARLWLHRELSAGDTRIPA